MHLELSDKKVGKERDMLALNISFSNFFVSLSIMKLFTSRAQDIPNHILLVKPSKYLLNHNSFFQEEPRFKNRNSRFPLNLKESRIANSKKI